MSSMAKTAREAMKAKAKRLGSDRPLEKVDSSTFTPPELLNAQAKTGMRPISKPKFKKGGKVSGQVGVKHAGRKARKSGGRALTADSLINRDLKEANEKREGIKHIGALKRGGKAMRTCREEGGKVDVIGDFIKKDTTPTPKPAPKQPSDNTPAVTPAQAQQMRTRGHMNPDKARKAGGRTKKMMGGSMMGGGAGVSDKAFEFQGNPVTPGLKRGGRAGKAGGGMLEAAKRAMMLSKDSRRKNARPAPLSQEDIEEAMRADQARGARGYLGMPRKKGGKVHEDVAEDKKLIKKMVKPSARTGKAIGGAFGQFLSPALMLANAVRGDDKKRGGRTGKANGGAEGDMERYVRETNEARSKRNDEYNKKLQPSMDAAFDMIKKGFSEDKVRKMYMDEHDARMKDPKYAAGRAKRGMDPDVNPFADKSKSLAQLKREDDRALEKGYAASQKKEAEGGDDELPGSVKVGNAMAKLFGGNRSGRKAGGGVFSGAGYPHKVPGVTGGRQARATGGKAKGKGKGKTNINIVIAAGKPQGADAGAMPPGAMPKPPGGIPIPLGAQGGPPQGGAPMPMPVPMPMPAPAGGPAGGPPMARKSGGRISKVAKSYKDMTAGAGSGEGRLQKTDIAKRTNHKAGGKVYRSYKDMDAGAGSGFGRLEKTEIAKHKK